MSTKVRAEWDGYNWVGEVEGGGVTQAKRLELLRERAVEVAKLMSGKVIDADDVAFEIVVPGIDITEVADEIARLDLQVHELQARLMERRRATVRVLKKHGFTLRDIGTITGLSHQRVDQLLS